MLDEESKASYYMFKCRNFACKEIISVQFFLTRQNLSIGIFPMASNHEIDNDIPRVDAKCPFCKRMNNFQINESVKEISMREYESQMKVANAKIALMKVVTNFN
jgi:hypothetical protein